MGWQIFVHSFNQVFGNLGAALRVSALLTLVQLAATLAFGRVLLVDQEIMQHMMMTGEFPWGKLMLLILISTVAGLWIAVGWHRYVLLEEEGTVLPPLRVDRILGYFGKTILISLLLVVVAIPLGIVAGLIAGPMMQNARSLDSMYLAIAVMAVLVYLPVLVIGLRLMTVLPGVALEAGVPLFTGWQATKGHTGAIFLLAVLLIAANFGLGFLIDKVFSDPAATPAILASSVVQWFVGMVGISALTTLYGHFVEGRPLRV